MKLENKNNKILDDLNTRNENWEKLDGIPEKVSGTELKVAKVERELDQFSDTVSNINTNQEAKQSVSGYGVIGLPKTVGEGHADFSIKGVTDENGISTQGASRLKSVGKNLFDGEFELGSLSNLGNNMFDSNNPLRVRTKDFTEVPSNTVLIISSGSKTLILIALYDSQYRFIERITNLVNLDTSLYPNLKYIKFVLSEKPLNEVQLEKGTIATPYEPYQETTQYINASTLRSLPNGVADEVKNGKFIQRVGVTDIDNVTVRSVVTTISEDFDYLDIVLPNNSVTENILRKTNIGGMTHITISSSQRRIGIEFPKGTIETVAVSEMAGVEIIYQLAEPIITPINVSGNLISYPSGTVYIEQVVADAGLYTNKMEILNTELPIKTIDKLSKVDYTTGLEHQLDISKAVVSGTSFTHPDLVENDIVFFEYYYDLESTNGNASIEYFDSRYTITDSVTDKIYKWTIAIADGVPSIEIEEV